MGETITDYEWLTYMGMCHKCRKQKAAPGRHFCFDCLEKIREENARRYDPEKAVEYQGRRREIYREKKAAGICTRCSRPATHGLYCYECSVKVRRNEIRQAERRKRERHERGLIPKKRRESGLCLWCGEPAMPGFLCCSRHKKIIADAGKKGSEANLRNGNNPWIKEVEAWRKRNRQQHSGNG